MFVSYMALLNVFASGFCVQSFTKHTVELVWSMKNMYWIQLPLKLQVQ